ncbi:hypothetical protein PsYK624_151100 [Phanerochaete sordida]|uniref:Uncharacterized protein n=1 Tax=Phanerochaete sordida TaxID=48140 RepID=A0A9P3GPT5_9APHY|nr:hypothetical protein PsYK624_151100 [Phanerochaete sordida]
MHHCLEVQDIVQLIAEALGTKVYATKQDVLNMGKTCTAFYDPAMNVLWRKLHDFTPLLRCFPEGVVTNEYQREHCGGRYSASFWAFLKGELLAEDVIRFNHHAHRVRELYRLTTREILEVDEEENRRMRSARWYTRVLIGIRRRENFVHPSCFKILCNYFGDTPALPGLRVLHCNHPGLEKASHLAFLIPPTLEILVMRRQHALFPIKDFLSELAKRPQLEQLCYALLEPSDDDAECERQDPSFVDPEDVALLASFPRIQWLSCYLQSTSDWTSLAPRLPSTPFKDLRLLTLYSGMVKMDGTDNYYKADGDATLRGLTLFLQALNPTCPLESLVIRVFHAAEVSTRVLLGLFSAIGAFRATLETCYLEVDAPSSADAPPVGMSALEPLRAVHMHGLGLKNISIDLSASEVRALTEAWGAALRWLHLGQRGPGTVARVPLGAVPEIFGALHKIEQLGLCVYDDASTYSGRWCGWRSVLDLGYSALDPVDYEDVAEFLVDTCPCYSMRLADPDDETVHALWEQAVDNAKEGASERARARREASGDYQSSEPDEDEYSDSPQSQDEDQTVDDESDNEDQSEDGHSDDRGDEDAAESNGSDED